MNYKTWTTISIRATRERYEANIVPRVSFDRGKKNRYNRIIALLSLAFIVEGGGITVYYDGTLLIACESYERGDSSWDSRDI